MYGTIYVHALRISCAKSIHYALSSGHPLLPLLTTMAAATVSVGRVHRTRMKYYKKNAADFQTNSRFFAFADICTYTYRLYRQTKATANSQYKHLQWIHPSVVVVVLDAPTNGTGPSWVAENYEAINRARTFRITSRNRNACNKIAWSIRTNNCNTGQRQ